MIMIESSQVVEMKEGNTIAPYVFKRTPAKYLFSLNYVTVQECVPQMCQLHRASTLPLTDQTAMIHAIVLSRQSRVKFDPSWLENLYESIMMEVQGDHITPLVTNPGRIMLTSQRLYFQPFNNIEPYPVLKIKLSEIKQLIKRRFLLRHVGLEIFCPGNNFCSHLYLALHSNEIRDQLYNKIVQQEELKLENTGQEDITLRWQNGLISNYDYLMYLNSMADRSFNDLTQYPVFPWVIADYSSPYLDLTNPKTFRDLSKPIGALNESRLQRLKERYEDMPEPRFLYGSHYSTPGYILFYLARLAPEYVLCLQNGRFDMPDRMFNSMEDLWNNCINGASDFKESIPEFYKSSGEFLVNGKLINFGAKQDGRSVGVVALPPWAADAADFIKKMRDALESEYVSAHLHEWIDLIFGYKQQGAAAIEADNVFYYLTYEGAVDISKITDLNERRSLEAQVMEFGQTPKQLFKSPHPQRSPPSISTNTKDKDASIAVVETQDKKYGDEELTVGNDLLCSKTVRPAQWTDMDQLQPYLHHKLHKLAITDVKISSDGKSVFSVSQDTLLKVYSVEDQRQQRSINLSNMPLSSCLVMPNCTTVVVGSWDNSITFYSIEYGKILHSMQAHDDAVSGILWQDDLLISSSWDSTVKLWNYSPSESKHNFPGVELQVELDHESGVSCISVNSDNTIIASGTIDGHVYLWDISSQYPIYSQQAHLGRVFALQFSPDGHRLLSTGEDQYLRVIDINTGTEVYAKDTNEKLHCLAWDGFTALAGSCNGDLLIWDLVHVQLNKRINGHKGAILCIHVGDDGRVVTGGEDRQVTLWKIT